MSVREVSGVPFWTLSCAFICCTTSRSFGAWQHLSEGVGGWRFYTLALQILSKLFGASPVLVWRAAVLLRCGCPWTTEGTEKKENDIPATAEREHFFFGNHKAHAANVRVSVVDALPSNGVLPRSLRGSADFFQICSLVVAAAAVAAMAAAISVFVASCRRCRIVLEVIFSLSLFCVYLFGRRFFLSSCSCS